MHEVIAAPKPESGFESEERVDILLSTFNGERYFLEQIRSVLDQSHQNIRVIIRDDGSTDGTVALVKQQQKKDSRIQFIENTAGNLGPARSFMELLRHSTAPYIMFCDQDDVWRARKVQISIAALSGRSRSEPCLVQSDLEVVSENLNLISKSYISRHNLPNRNVFADLLVQNNVTGCTVLFNASLRLIAQQYTPSYMVMHDGWLALIASLYGTVVMIDEPLIQYRQHSSNAVGSKKGLWKFLERVRSPKKLLAIYAASEKQARELNKLKAEVHDFIPHQRESSELVDYLSYCDGGIMKRISFFFHSKYRKKSVLSNFIYRSLFVLLTFFGRK
ncbi:MAG: glycosyltransferase family 2 protein [Halioglobus sp.]|nr:glycosyltransferase family 2 protein [Halioglobus sp.]